MKYSRAEQETTITWDEEEKVAHIFTASPVTMRRLDKLVEQYPEAYRHTWSEDGETAKKYEVDAKYIRFGKPASEARRAIGRRCYETSLQNRF